MQEKGSKRNLDRIMPVRACRGGCLVSRRGEITIGWELSLPETYTLEERDYDTLYASLASAVRRLDPWCIVHRQDVFMTRRYKARQEERFLSAAYEHHFDGRPYLEHRCFIYLTQSSKQYCSAKTADCGLYRFFSKETRLSDDEIRMFVVRSGEFIATLCGTKVVARQLTDDDYLGEGMSLGLFDMHRRLWRDVPEVIRPLVFRDSMVFGDYVFRSYDIAESVALPGVFSSPIVDPLMSSAAGSVMLSYGSRLGVSLNCDHVVNHYIMTLPQDSVRSEMGLRLRRMSADSGNVSNDVSHDEMSQFMRIMEAEGEIVVRAHMDVHFWATKDKIEEATSAVSLALSDLNITAARNTYDASVSWYASMPGASSELGDEHWMRLPLGPAVALLPMETFGHGMEEGTFPVCDRQTHVPVRLDFRAAAMRNGLITNYNKFLVGPSGSGKSFWTNHFLHSCYEDGQHCFVIDVGGSYMGLSTVINEESGGEDGAYYAWDNKHPLNFDPFLGFEGWLSAEGTLVEEESGVSCFLSFLQSVWEPVGGWTDEARGVLRQMVQNFTMDNRGRTGMRFDDFHQYVFDKVRPSICAVGREVEREGGKEMVWFFEGRQVQPFILGRVPVGVSMFDVDKFLASTAVYAIGGSHEKLLNDPAPKDLLAHRFVVFDLDRLQKACKPKSEGEKMDPFYGAVILFLMNAIDFKMRTIVGPKQVSIDEAWQALQSSAAAGYIQEFYKTGRKHGCGFMVITQQLSDLKKSPVVADAIVQNSDVKILLDQSSNENDFRDGIETLGLTPRDVSMVMSMNKNRDPRYLYREFFVKWTSRFSGVYALEASVEEALVYESEFEKKEPVLKLARELGSYRAAVAESADMLRKKKAAQNK